MRNADLCLDTSVADYFAKAMLLDNGELSFNKYTVGTLFSDSANSSTLALLMESAQNNGYLEYIKHPSRIIEHHKNNGKVKPENLLTKFFDDKKEGKFQALWLTNLSNPKAIKATDFNNYLEQGTKALNSGYKMIIWTNLDKDIFWNIHQLQKKFVSELIEIKNIADLDTQYINLKNLLLSPDRYLPSTLDKAAYTGFLVDLAKYLILEQEGGLLADLNFKFVQDFDPENLEQYDYVGNKCLAGGLERVENNFFYSKSHHPIFKETLNIIEEMIFNPSYGNEKLLNIGLDSTQFVEHYSMMPYSIGYIKGFNQDGNNDAMQTITFPGTLGKSCEDTYAFLKNRNQDFSPELKAKIEEYEALTYNLENIKNKDILREVILKLYTIREMLFPYQDYQCVDGSLVGEDTQTMSWGSASLF